jgi:hypothetical protein
MSTITLDHEQREVLRGELTGTANSYGDFEFAFRRGEVVTRSKWRGRSARPTRPTTSLSPTRRCGRSEAMRDGHSTQRNPPSGSTS